MDDWANDLEKLWDFAWQKLHRGAADAKSPLHRPAFATAGREGGAEARIVVLRSASPSRHTLEVHTDSASAKVAELVADPRATLLFWDPKSNLQLRARVRVEMVAGDAEAWEQLGEGARMNYGGTPSTGTSIGAPDAYDKTPARERHTQLIGHLQSLDAVYLGPEHRRALYSRDDGFAGTWLAP
ncbi:pyridoxamine 5'-phosphate oxidase family protein [Palleronia pelagia]|uniref:Pyridoxamine 5'-phosphate oxidase n=1 Tax=Palleronia pelagia TaxID=387096 RepID=A0A1H8IG66_9RHOB|nr:pyridoxamine 5'-phosphate oxidase family protein [Palleronia pelagia]SEN67653.1 Pyridoxamine 5'-phosphate oxidase [Palleronia pelagia]